MPPAAECSTGCSIASKASTAGAQHAMIQQGSREPTEQAAPKGDIPRCKPSHVPADANLPTCHGLTLRLWPTATTGHVAIGDASML
mmetsp:Transcript_16533/g.41273  ORF Transcript_16533/g.41273 Transcript_16533/m.41273 type:complete len:86 (-) Transcript_16533:284-541(-)